MMCQHFGNNEHQRECIFDVIIHYAICKTSMRSRKMFLRRLYLMSIYLNDFIDGVIRISSSGKTELEKAEEYIGLYNTAITTLPSGCDKDTYIRGCVTFIKQYGEIVSDEAKLLLISNDINIM